MSLDVMGLWLKVPSWKLFFNLGEVMSFKMGGGGGDMYLLPALMYALCESCVGKE